MFEQISIHKAQNVSHIPYIHGTYIYSCRFDQNWYDSIHVEQFLTHSFHSISLPPFFSPSSHTRRPNNSIIIHINVVIFIIHMVAYLFIVASWYFCLLLSHSYTLIVWFSFIEIIFLSKLFSVLFFYHSKHIYITFIKHFFENIN